MQKAAEASPYIANVHNWGQAGERFLFFALEYCSGGDLRQRVVPAEGVADRPWMLRATREVLEGLCAMHARDITHLDLKPENILLTADGHVRIDGDSGDSDRKHLIDRCLPLATDEVPVHLDVARLELSDADGVRAAMAGDSDAPFVAPPQMAVAWHLLDHWLGKVVPAAPSA